MNEWELTHISPLNLLSKLLYLKFENNLKKIIHFHGSFGDIYLQLSVYSELQDASGNLLLIDSKYNSLVINVKKESDCIAFINSNSLNLEFSKLGILGNNIELPIRLLATLYPIIPELLSRCELQYSTFLRFLLNSNNKNQFKQLENREKTKFEVEKLFNDHNLIKGKTIILSPDNNTQQEFSQEFWSDCIDYIEELNWIPVLNDSGNLINNQSKFIFNKNLKKIKIPPHLAVSIPEFAGAYIGGTNGFQTIQAMFNLSDKGMHLINITSLKNELIEDNFGNKISMATYFHSKAFRNEFLNKQIEILCLNKFDNFIKNQIKEILTS